MERGRCEPMRGLGRWRVGHGHGAGQLVAACWSLEKRESCEPAFPIEAGSGLVAHAVHTCVNGPL